MNAVKSSVLIVDDEPMSDYSYYARREILSGTSRAYTA
jgi:hypothetical protein